MDCRVIWSSSVLLTGVTGGFTLGHENVTEAGAGAAL